MPLNWDTPRVEKRNRMKIKKIATLKNSGKECMKARTSFFISIFRLRKYWNCTW
jgi:hypothetical protein